MKNHLFHFPRMTFGFLPFFLHVCKKPYIFAEENWACDERICLFGVMITHRKHKDIYSTIADGIHKPMLVGYATDPFSSHPFQRLWLSDTGKWMQLYIFQQFGNALHDSPVSCFNQ